MRCGRAGHVAIDWAQKGIQLDSQKIAKLCSSQDGSCHTGEVTKHSKADSIAQTNELHVYACHQILRPWKGLRMPIGEPSDETFRVLCEGSILTDHVSKLRAAPWRHVGFQFEEWLVGVCIF